MRVVTRRAGRSALAALASVQGAVGAWTVLDAWRAWDRAPGMGEVLGALILMAIGGLFLATGVAALALRHVLPDLRPAAARVSALLVVGFSALAWLMLGSVG